MASLNVISQPKPEVTILPNIFIDKYITTTNPTFIVVFLFFYRHFQSTPDLSTEYIADKFGILETDVINIFKYWEKTGLLKMHEVDGVFDIDLIFSDKAPADTKPAPAPKQIITESKPVYAIEELELYKLENRDIQRLFALGEKTLGKLLHYNDLNALFALYDWLRLPIDVIEILLNYCEENDRRNMRYIEKAAIDWAENGIRTVDDALEYVSKFNSKYREIMKAFGLSRRDPTQSEQRYMDKWLGSLPIEIILEACDKTIIQIGQPKFAYADKIISGWVEKDVKTLGDIKSLETDFKESQPKEKAKLAEVKANIKPNRFANFKQREWDDEQLKKLETAYLK